MPVREVWNRKSVRVLAAVLLLTGVYAVLGFVAAPRMLRSALLKDIPAALDVTPTVGAVRVNPFLLQISIDGFALTAPDGAKLLGFERLFVDFDLSSLWHRAYTFGRIDLVAPFVDAAVAGDGSLNLMRLEPKASPQPASPGGSLPPLRIGAFSISRGSIDYVDRSRPDVFTAHLDPVDFELRDFTTGAGGGQFTLSGASKQGGRLEWRGHAALQPIESDGELHIEGLPLRTLWEYLEARVGFVVNSGTLDLGARYAFSAGNGGAPPKLTVDLAEAALRNLAVRPKQGDTDWVTLPALEVKGTHVDVPGRNAHVDSVTLTGLKVLAWRAADGSFNLLELAGPPSAARAPAAATPAPLTAASPPWTYDVQEFRLQEADLSVEDRSAHPALKLRLAPLAVTLTGASQDLGKPVRVVLQTRINGKGTLEAAGSVAPQPAAADLDLKLEAVELADVQPLIGQYTAMTLLGGRLGMQASLHYGGAPPVSGAKLRAAVPPLKVSGSLAVDGLHTVDDALHQDFVDWDRLELRGLTYTQAPDRLDIDKILLRKPYARVTIESDATTNIKRVLTGPGAATRTAAPSAPAAAAAAGGAPLPMMIKQVLVEDGEADFADLTVEPHFAAGIHALAGTITGLSSQPKTRARLELKGLVDTFSPVTIAGDMNVLGPLYADVTVAFRNISLPVFNPYAGKFAGYDIAEGKLSTEFHYQVDGRKLDAQHHIVIDQLEFGDKTASKQAVSLPVKLAVALLKDRNGVIDLNIPVTGSLDDPDFRIAPIVWKVVVNLLEKAVTAPFALLGSLFGAGPEMQFIDFAPGVSTLDPAATDKAKAVAKALAERPQIKLEVPLGVVPDVDRPALLATHFGETIGVPSLEPLDPAAQLAALTRGYVKLFGAEPRFPDPVSTQTSTPDAVAAKIAFLDRSVHERLTVSDEDLQLLGQRRAAALQQALLSDTQIDPERVFLIDNDKAAAHDGRVRLELSLR